VLEFIRAFRRRHGYSPSVREIGEALGISSTSVVSYHIGQLERSGMLQREAGKSRTLVPAE
jgi:repressor LexA